MVLNPKAEHLWTFIHTAAINMSSINGPDSIGESTEFLRAISERNLDNCRKYIQGVIETAADLPPRATELEAPVEEILADLPAKISPASGTREAGGV